MSETLTSGTSVLAVVASALLVFVSGGVVYLSAIEWRDRRRRDRAAIKRR
ncbi:hypothetical protein KBY66_08345 [Synechococcus sp. Tobar12-5m-g]|jgi:hypothetical protein|nr:MULTISPECIES: hypothetical protein [unclassified Synechococcus]MCP9772635.1 hypothetical protein [Synechococcus sp. Tobar12-5m-g]MCP9873509.1 hypothetical protein [Synechococcus sp. Cruz CV-v-12]